MIFMQQVLEYRGNRRRRWDEMKKKKYKDMTPEERRTEDLRIAKKNNRQSRILSLTAIAIVILRAFVRAYLQSM